MLAVAELQILDVVGWLPVESMQQNNSELEAK